MFQKGKEIKPLLWFDGHGTRFYTRVERNKSPNWQLVTEQGMWKALHISLLPTRWSGYIYIGQKLITTFASSDIFIWPVIKVRDKGHCQNDEFLEKVRTAFNPTPSLGNPWPSTASSPSAFWAPKFGASDLMTRGLEALDKKVWLTRELTNIH